MKNKFELFVYLSSGGKAGSDKAFGEKLLKRAAVLYGTPKKKAEAEVIMRQSGGKPYFGSLDLHFSISHSENVWSVLIGPECCGLDLQYIKPCNLEKIAGRFFSAAERDFILTGEEGRTDRFFRLWTRREALGKFTGKGFFAPSPELVFPKGGLKETVMVDHNKWVRFVEPDISGVLSGQRLTAESRCCVCIGAGAEPDIKIRRI